MNQLQSYTQFFDHHTFPTNDSIKNVVFTNFDDICGPNIVLAENSVQNKIFDYIPRLLDFNLCNDVFYFGIGNDMSVNYVFTTPNKYQRGSENIFMISIVIEKSFVDKDEKIEKTLKNFKNLISSQKDVWKMFCDTKSVSQEERNDVANILYNLFMAYVAYIHSFNNQ